MKNAKSRNRDRKRKIAAPGRARDQPVMTSTQYGCREEEREEVLSFCRKSDEILQFVLGRTASATGPRWGTILALVILAAIAASIAGWSPR